MRDKGIEVITLLLLAGEMAQQDFEDIEGPFENRDGYGVAMAKKRVYIISIIHVMVQSPGRRPIKLCRACFLVAAFCSWVLTGRGNLGKTPPGQMDSRRSRRYCTQWRGHVRLATCTSSHLWQMEEASLENAGVFKAVGWCLCLPPDSHVEILVSR